MAIEFISNLFSNNPSLSNSNFGQIIEDIEYFGISSQIYHLLKERHMLDGTPLFFQERLKNNYTSVLYKNLLIKNQTEMILKLLEKLEIEVIPLKGVVFAERYFGHFGARATTDIDILIKRKDIKRVITCIKELGFTQEHRVIQSHFHYSFSKLIPGSPLPLTIELHWDILTKNSSNLNIEDFWKNSTPYKDYKYVKELSDYHTFYFTLLHCWRHNLDSLKYFIDVIQLIYYLNGNIDYSKLVKEAYGHKTQKRVIRTLSIIYEQFPQLDEILPFPYKKTLILWKYSYFRYKEERSLRKYISFIDYQYNSYDLKKHCLNEIINYIRVK
jgi:hypothetical protein